MLKDLEKELSSLNKMWLSLSNAGSRTSANDIQGLKDRYSKLEDSFSKIKIEDLIGHDVGQIEAALGKILKGINMTKGIQGYNDSINETLESYSDLKKGIGILEGDIATLEEDVKEDMNKTASITNLLDKVAASLEAKGLTKEAEQLDIIANTLDSLQSWPIKLFNSFMGKVKEGMYRRKLNALKSKYSGNKEVESLIKKFESSAPIEALAYALDRLSTEGALIKLSNEKEAIYTPQEEAVNSEMKFIGEFVADLFDISVSKITKNFIDSMLKVVKKKDTVKN